MKKEVMIILSIIFFLSFAVFLSAQVEECDAGDENCRVGNAYTCLDERTEECSTLTLQEQIFSSLTLNKCTNLILNASDDNKCWPSGNCDIKTTAQAILALKEAGLSTSDAEEWLISQNETSTNLIWYLQIWQKESNVATQCDIDYAGTTNTIIIGEDKKINSNAGSCLVLAQDNYWLRVSSNCYDEDFSVSCDKGFLTNTLYQKQGSSTIYVSQDTKDSSEGGTLTEKVDSVCFGEGSCDYEGSLWAALVLDSLDNDISPFMPYLITLSDETANDDFLPEAFLYMLTNGNEYRAELLNKQKTVNNQKYWDESGDIYYDTALALLSFQNSNPVEKTDSEEWLLSEGVQTPEGCWQSNNIRNTGFILYSLWSDLTPNPSQPRSTLVDCQDAGYSCISSISCAETGGTVLDRNKYYCSTGVNACCSEDLPKITCSERSGEICSSSEVCEGGTNFDSSDLALGEICCVQGTCQEKGGTTEFTACELAGGTCGTSCSGNEEELFKSCEFSSEICCKEKSTTTPPGNVVLIIVLVVLIALVILGIVFRNKLKLFWTRFRSGRRPGPKGPGPRGPPPRNLRGPPSGRPQLGVMPTGRFPQPRARPAPGQRPKSELDDVLTKLKSMGK